MSARLRCGGSGYVGGAARSWGVGRGEEVGDDARGRESPPKNDSRGLAAESAVWGRWDGRLRRERPEVDALGEASGGGFSSSFLWLCFRVRSECRRCRSAVETESPGDGTGVLITNGETGGNAGREG